MNIVFMGTPDFAVPSLKALVEKGYNVMAVVTQPDKPKGRGNKLAAPPVKDYALSQGIEVLQPVKIKNNEEFLVKLKELAPDLMITCSYGKLIPQEVLDVPPLGCINVHGSLLPKYRGAAPIQWSIINGDKKTGITTMFTVFEMDAGDMLLKKEVDITDEMNSQELYDILSKVGAEVLIDTIELMEQGRLVRIPQEHDKATHVSKLTKETGLIDWSKDACSIHNLVRGVYPWPIAYTFYKGERMRVIKTKVMQDKDSLSESGKILQVNNDGILVAAGKGTVLIEQVQFDGGKAMRVVDYLRGHSLEEGLKLGR